MPVSMKTVWTADSKVLSVVDKKMLRFMNALGASYTRDVQNLMKTSPRGGVNKNSRGQSRSGPGEPPAPDKGDLIRSTRFVVRKTVIGWVMEAGSTLRKAVYLEFGAARGRVMQARDNSGKFTKAKTMSWILYPRPAWGPALLRLKANLPSLLARVGGNAP